MTDQILLEVFNRLMGRFGPRGWWPGETPFEVCIGAILVQNTSWTNAARAITNLKDHNLLSPEGLRRITARRLAKLIRPARFFNIKTDRLKAFIGLLWGGHEGKLDRLFDRPTALLRTVLLEVKGIGLETADSILLYAAQRPVFVVDAYTHRIFARLGFYKGPVAGQKGYENLQELFHRNLPRDTSLYNEFHALLVELGKEYCRPRPICGPCPLNEICRHSAKSPDETANVKRDRKKAVRAKR